MAEKKEEQKKEEPTNATPIVAKEGKIEEVALERINQYIGLGLQLPNGFNPTNSLKKARMMLNDMTVSVMCNDGQYHEKPALEVCDRNSIIQCLIDACCKGLDYSESQMYMIARLDKNKGCYKMTNMESIYGRIVRAKRASKYYKDNVAYVHKGDTFKVGVFTYTDLMNNRCKENDLGKYYIIQHDINMDSLDEEITHAYTYVTDNDGNTTLCYMTKKEWLKSWSKSSMKNGNKITDEFERDMIYRTIIKKATKYLVNSNVSGIEDDDSPLAGNNPPEIKNEQEVGQEFEEAQIVEETAQIAQTTQTTQQEETKEPTAPVEQKNNDAKVSDNNIPEEPPF